MINREFKIYIVSEEEKKQLELEELNFEVKEKIETGEMSVYRIDMPDEERESVEIALEFIRSKTKGYGTCHIMDLCVIPSINVRQKTIGFKELIRLHHYNGAMESILFTAEKKGNNYFIKYTNENSIVIDILTK